MTTEGSGLSGNASKLENDGLFWANVMKYRMLWMIGLLCVGCGSTRSFVMQQSSISTAPVSTVIAQSPSPPSSLPSPTLSPTAIDQPGPGPATDASPNLLAETPPETSPEASAETAADPAESEPQQDYDWTTPIPATGKLTVRNDIRNLDLSRLITDCPADSAPYAFAESTNYLVQICSQEYDPWQPKYYIGQAKDGSGELRITSAAPNEARQLIFKSQGYTYILYRDGARPEQINAYLQVFTPTGKNYAEALWYFYEARNSPNF